MWRANRAPIKSTPRKEKELSAVSPQLSPPASTPSGLGAATPRTPNDGRSPVVSTPMRRLSDRKKDPTLSQIEKIEKQRELRRKQMAEAKQAREEEIQQNMKMGRPGDVDFQRMIKQYRTERGVESQGRQGETSREQKICICVRKRPVNEKEIKRHDYDSVTCVNASVIVHDCKLRVDGITKFLDNSEFVFDYAFGEDSTNEHIYHCTVRPLVDFILRKGRATVFAYGQTGSGKTYTMTGIHTFIIRDLFKAKKAMEPKLQLDVCVSFFEIYGGRCQDLLNRRSRLDVREDGRGEVQIAGLHEELVRTEDELLQMVDKGHRLRTTFATEQNDTSSRSHGICQITLRPANTKRLYGKLSLIDLAGSERAQDSRHHNRQRRLESAEINKSLLALKECIRALDSGGAHVPYRASKLTLVLKDSFSIKGSRTVMIANVSPSASSADHTLNTLRYAYRIKEKAIPSSNESRASAPLPGTSEEMTEKPSRKSHRIEMDLNLEFDRLDVERAEDEDLEDDSLNIPEDLQDLSGVDDIKFLHDSLKRFSGDDFNTSSELLEQFHETVQTLYQEEEDLLHSHMNCIQENAQLLTEEGQLLANVQGEGVVDYDIDAYASRLEEIIDRRLEITTKLRSQLAQFRKRLQDEEAASSQIDRIVLY